MTLQTNASLLKAYQNNTLAQLDYKKVCFRDYPYLKMNGGYGYTFNKYDIATNIQRGNLGANFGLTIGFNLFDGNRRRERQQCTYCHSECPPGTRTTGTSLTCRPEQLMASLPEQPANAEPGTPEPCSR